jgi:hypothetical protein
MCLVHSTLRDAATPYTERLGTINFNMTSDQIIDILRQHGLDQYDALLFEHSPKSLEYGRITDFYNAALSNLGAYEHNPSVFYIQQESVNFRAIAHRVDGLGVIVLSPPFLEYLWNCAHENDSVLINILENSVHADTIFEGGLSQFVYDFSLHFIFYHELGHLIQNRTGIYQAFDLDENHDDKDYDFLIHALETDADEFAALSSFQHIFDYTRRLQENGTTITERALLDYC